MEKSHSGFEDQWGGGDGITVVNREVTLVGIMSRALLGAKSECEVTSPEPGAERARSAH